MPAAQVIDLTPRPDPRFEGFGRGFMDTMVKRQQQQQELDAVQSIMSKYQPGMNANDFLRETMGSNGNLSFDRRKELFETISAIDKQRKEEDEKKTAKNLQEQAAIKFGEQYGIDPAVAKVLGPKEMSNIIKEQMKHGPIDTDTLNAMTAFNQNPEVQKMDDLSYRNAALAANIPPAQVDKMVNIRQKASANAATKEMSVGQRMQYYNPIITKVRADAEDGEKKLRSFNRAEELLKTKKVGPQSFWNTASTIFPDNPIAQVIQHPENAEFRTLAYSSVVGTKQDFGVRLSDADLRLVQDKIISADKTPEMNRRVINYMRVQEEAKIEKSKIQNQILKENGGIPPVGYDVELDERMKASSIGQRIEKEALGILAMDEKGNEMGVWMVDPDTGARELIDSSGVKDMEEIGFKRL